LDRREKDMLVRYGFVVAIITLLSTPAFAYRG
jgi:hypothetical protein